jgi:F-type H+-transporting ATPase subunit b
MLAIIYSFLLVFSEAAHSAGGGESGFTHIWNTYFNYPGFEAWKFINLAIFVGLMIYLLKKPLSDTFRTKREEIRAELIQAEAEKQAALQKLTETEAKLARLSSEVSTVKDRAAQEATAEKNRIIEQTEAEIAKLREQANNEIERTGKQAKNELRKFSAEESIRLAEEMIKKNINDTVDAKIVKSGIESIGGLK